MCRLNNGADPMTSDPVTERRITKVRAPFGQADCESEMKTLKAEYSKLYFDESPFNAAALDDETYLIIGRRGSGKTALAQYFSFQRALPNPIYIDVDEPVIYQSVLEDISSRASELREIAIPKLVKLWEVLIWSAIFENTKYHAESILTACDPSCSDGSVSRVIGKLITKLCQLFEDGSSTMEQRLEDLLRRGNQAPARRSVLEIARTRPIIVAIDTLERYDTTNGPLMNAMAALIQWAASFNAEHAHAGLHIKLFVAAEVFPHLKEGVLLNPLKSIRSPVYLFWRPKDLLRLISWRYYRYLDDHNLLLSESKGTIDWEDPREVMQKVWITYFGQDLVNGRGLPERTFAYVLRHTQMRPRQLILLCNAIAKQATAGRTFPRFSGEDIRDAVKETEGELASEIINSFSAAYPNVASILEALMRSPVTFRGNELDRRAKETASSWPAGTYSLASFRKLVAEIGVVGRVRRRNDEAAFLDADFEYAMKDRLSITHRDECVIHPMFYSRLNIAHDTAPTRVMPFSTERDSREAQGHFS
jgi:hypothetical protein